MSGRSFTIKELGFDPRKLGPNSPLRNVSPRAPRADHEHEEQVRFFEWVRETEAQIPELRRMFAVPNFSGRIGRLTAKQSARLNAEGRRKGVLDIWWPFRSVTPDGRIMPGLVIEMKYGRNTLTTEQDEWKSYLEEEGWCVVVCYSWTAARDITIDYYHGRLAG